MTDSNKPEQRKEFSGANIKVVVGNLIKAYKSGELDNLDGNIAIQVLGEQMSQGEKDWNSKKAV